MSKSSTCLRITLECALLEIRLRGPHNRWWLFLQEYDIQWGIEQGINMGPADALSWKDEIETSNDNREITLLKGRDQYFHIRAIDAALAKKIFSSTAQDPIVTKALAAMNHDGGEPWIP